MTDRAVDLLKAVAHPLRFAILSSLSGREMNVGDIEKSSGIGQPTLSQQLAVLRKAGLVRARREAKLVFYRIEPSTLQTAVLALTGLLPRTEASASRDRLKGLGGAAVFARTD